MGLGEMLEPEPELNANAAEALHAWSFLGGWRLDLLPFYMSMYTPHDAERLIELVQYWRDLLANPAALAVRRDTTPEVHDGE